MDACDRMKNAIIFIDEIDSLAQSRENEAGIHEVSKRILSVLLTKLEGFHGKSNSILICATNRKDDLDKALLSRFDLMIQYHLPDYDTRREIFQRYAKHLTGAKKDKTTSFETLAKISSGLSCRDLKEACEQAERICASRVVHQRFKQEQSNNDKSKPETRKIVIGENGEVDLPSLDDYIHCVQMKMQDQKITDKSSAQI
jgi:ATP-dependent 26S proteasome regulatory subunit